MNIERAALPGYNALTDTNPDHFAVYSDQNNVLIKELFASQQNIPEFNILETLSHDLGYVPLSFVFAHLSSADSRWSHVTNQYNPVSVPQVIQAIDTKNLYIYNFGGRGSDLPTFARVFYDDMSGDSFLQRQTARTNPGTMADDGSVGSVSWSNPNNAKVSDNVYAVANFGSTPGDTHYLKATNFGFAVPSDAIINGIYVAKEGKFTGGGGGFSAAKLVVGGSVVGTEHQKSFGTEAYYSSGELFDLWGLSLTPADINDPNFGVALYTHLTSASSASVSIDNIQMKIYYRTSGHPTFTEDTKVIKVAKSGISAASTNPNDFIMHSSLNNLKILYQDTHTIALSSGMNSFAHGKDIADPIQCLAFVKFPDGKATLTGMCLVWSYDETKWIKISVDETNIYIESSGSFTIDVSYFFFGTGKNGLISPIGMRIACAKDGMNALTDTNPDNFNFHSHFPTLKYYYEDSFTMGNVTTTTVQTVNHALGYIPFFAGYVSDLFQFPEFNGNSEPVYALTPYFLARSTFGSPNKDVGAFIYADANNIYFKAYFQTNAIGTSFPFNKFYYKLFKNNLNL